MLYEAKYIDKNRVVSKLGKVSNEFLNKIYNKLFQQIFEPIYYKMKKSQNINSDYIFSSNNKKQEQLIDI